MSRFGRKTDGILEGAEGRSLTLSGSRRVVAPPLQHRTTAQCTWLETSGPGNHRPNGPEADHALTFKLDHSVGADQSDIRPHGPGRKLS